MSPRIHRQLSCLLAVLGAAGAAGPLQASPTGLRELSWKSRDFAARWARAVIRGKRPAGDVPRTAPTEFGHPSEETVVLSLLGRGRRPLAAAGRGENFGRALARAIRALDGDIGARFGEGLARKVRLRIDRIGRIRELGPLQPGVFRGPTFRPGLDGLMLSGHERQAMVMPYEITFQGLSRVIKLDEAGLARSLLEGLGAAGARPEEPVRVFATRAFQEVRPGETAAASRLMPATGDFQPEVLERSLELAARHLVRIQKGDGRFLYAQDPVRGEALKGENYVRQAAVVMTAAEMLPILDVDHPLRKTVERGMGFLVRSLRTRKLPRGGSLKVPPPDRKDGPSLGAIALFARALSVAPAPLTDEPYMKAARRRLGKALRFMQRPDGSWYQNLGQALRGEPPLVKPRFFPGEALLALSELAAADPEGPWLDLAGRSADREQEDYRRGSPIDHWVVQGLSRFAVLTGDESAARTAYEMGRMMARSQVLDRSSFAPGDLGGFSSDGQHVTVVHSGCYGEAIREARKAAWRFGFDPRPLDAALIRLGTYLTGQQVRPEGAWFLRSPKTAVGGWPSGPTDYRQRIDIDGHAIRALLGTWEALHDVRPVPVVAELVDALDRRAG